MEAIHTRTTEPRNADEPVPPSTFGARTLGLVDRTVDDDIAEGVFVGDGFVIEPAAAEDELPEVLRTDYDDEGDGMA